MMMESSSREGYHEAKQEGTDNYIDKFSSKAIISSSSSSSRQWSTFRNPRIVRVSRSFGGKDRHSKVCTIRGLRDRRIRLSVPTAIQLYDLQDKLGVSQPSKVVDWLLEVTKLDIDKLPPLQFPQSFSQFHHHHQQQTLSSSSGVAAPLHHHHLSLGTFYDGGAYQYHQSLMMAKSSSRFWDLDSPSSRLNYKGKESLDEKGKWIKTTSDNNEQLQGNHPNNQDGVSSSTTTTQRLFPMGGTNSTTTTTTHHPTAQLPAALFNNAILQPSNSYHYSEPSSLSLSQFGSHGLMLDPHSMMSANSVQFPSSMQIGPSGSSQLFFGPPSAAPTPPIFTPFAAPFVANPSPMLMENHHDPRQFNNHFQFLNSTPLVPSSLHSFNSPVRPFPTPFSSCSKLGLDDSQDNNDNNNRSSQPDHHKGSSARS